MKKFSFQILLIKMAADKRKQKWICVDLGAENIHFSFSSATENPTTEISSFEKMTSSKKTQYMKPIFTIKKGQWKCGKEVLSTKAENIIFDATTVQNTNINGNRRGHGIFEVEKWHAEFVQNSYRLEAENGAILNIKQPQAIAAILSELQMSLMKSCKMNEKEEMAAMIVLPTFAGQFHRKIVKQAALVAGLSANVVLLNQTTAVVLGYWRKRMEMENLEIVGSLMNGVNQCEPKKYLLGVLSMGAKTTECSIFEFQPYQPPKLVKTMGFCDFGGADFTNALMHAFMEHVRTGIENKLAGLDREGRRKELKLWMKKFWMCCEEAKMNLSAAEGNEICLENPIGGENDEVVVIDANQFEQICRHQFATLEQLFKECFAEYNGKIEYFLLAGGSSRLKVNRVLIEKYIGTECEILNTSAYVPEYLAHEGAAVKAAQMSYISANMPLPDCFARLCMDEWIYRSISYSIADALIIDVAFPNTQLSAMKTLLASIKAHNQMQKIRTRSMQPPIVQINECTISSSFNLGRFILDENISNLMIDENGIVFIKDCPQNWEHPSMLLLNATNVVEVCVEVRNYKSMIIQAEKDKEKREKEEMDNVERKRKEREKKRKAAEEEKKQKIEEEEKWKLEEERKRKEEEERKRKEEEERKRKEEEERKRKEEEERKRKEEEEKKKVNWTFMWPLEAKSVILKGSWDNWKNEIPMERTETGTSFVQNIKLLPDYYEFIFFVKENAYDNGRYSTCFVYEITKNKDGYLNNYIFIDETKMCNNKGQDKDAHSNSINKKEVKSQAPSTDFEIIDKVGHLSLKTAAIKEEWTMSLKKGNKNQKPSSSSSMQNSAVGKQNNKTAAGSCQQQDLFDGHGKGEKKANGGKNDTNAKQGNGRFSSLRFWK